MAAKLARCLRCNGRGTLQGRECRSCQGTGKRDFIPEREAAPKSPPRNIDCGSFSGYADFVDDLPF